MNEVYTSLYKEYLGGKGAPEAEAERNFVGPFKSNPEAGDALRIETLMALKANKNAAFIGKIIKSVHDVGEVGAEWASQMVEHLLDKGKNCETVAVKAACCTALAEFSSKRLNQQEILHLLYHCTSDSRAAVREAAVEALGNMQEHTNLPPADVTSIQQLAQEHLCDDSKLVRVAAAGIISASKSGIHMLCKAISDKEAVVCAAALVRLAQIAPSIHSLNASQASAILSIATVEDSAAAAPGCSTSAAQCLVATWLSTERAVFARDDVSPADGFSGRRGKCESLQRVVGMLSQHPEDEGMHAVASVLSLADAVGTDHGEQLHTLILVLLNGGQLPLDKMAIACRAHSLGFLSPTPLSLTEAVFWRSVCSATAAIAADVNVFTDNPEAEVAEDALVALTPSGCEQWCAQIWRNVCAHGSQVCNTAPRTADTGAAGDFGVAKQLLAAMVACVDFDDDANRKAAVKMKISGTQSIETAGEWESEVVDACVAVCGEQEAALKIVSALVTTLKHPEASAVRHGASQVPGGQPNPQDPTSPANVYADPDRMCTPGMEAALEAQAEPSCGGLAQHMAQLSMSGTAAVTPGAAGQVPLTPTNPLDHSDPPCNLATALPQVAAVTPVAGLSQPPLAAVDPSIEKWTAVDPAAVPRPLAAAVLRFLCCVLRCLRKEPQSASFHTELRRALSYLVPLLQHYAVLGCGDKGTAGVCDGDEEMQEFAVEGLMWVAQAAAFNSQWHERRRGELWATETSAMLRQATLVLANRTDSTTPSTAHVAAAVTLVHACVLESAAAVDHAITTAAPPIPASRAFIADADERQAEERRAMPVLQLLMKTASWADQCASKLSSQASARDTPDDESYTAVSEIAQDLSGLLLNLLIWSSSMPSILSMHERRSVLDHALTSLFTSSTPPASSSSTNLDPLRAELERRLPVFACQSADSKLALVLALVPAARRVLNSQQCYIGNASASAAAGTAAVATTAPEAAKALVHCVLGLLLLPLAPGGASSAAESALPAEKRPESRASSGNGDDENATENGQEDQDRASDENASQGDAAGASVEAPQGGVTGGLKNAPEVWVYKLLLGGLKEVAVCSEHIKGLKLDKYIKQLLKTMRAESAPLHALTVPQVHQLQALAQRTIKALELEGHNSLIPDLEGLSCELRALVSPTASSLGAAASTAVQRTQQRPSPATSEDEDKLAGTHTDAENENTVPEDVEDALDADLAAYNEAIGAPLPQLDRPSSGTSKSRATKKGASVTSASSTARTRAAPPPAAPRSRRAAAVVKAGVYRDLTQDQWSEGELDSEPDRPVPPPVAPRAVSASANATGVSSEGHGAPAVRRSAPKAVPKVEPYDGDSDGEDSGLQPSMSNTSTASKRKRRDRKRVSGSAQPTQSAAAQRSEEYDSGDDSDASCAQSRKQQKPSVKPRNERRSDGAKSQAAKGWAGTVASKVAAREAAMKRGLAKRRQAAKEGAEDSGVSTGSHENRNTANVRSLVQGFENLDVKVKEEPQAGLGKEGVAGSSGLSKGSRRGHRSATSQ